jgi:hypothetical protein
MFGMQWRKSTSFLHVHVDLSRIGDMRCLGARRGLCKRTGRPHRILSGKTPEGTFWTKIAEPYPVALCKMLALAWEDHWRSARAQQLAELLFPPLGIQAAKPSNA